MTLVARLLNNPGLIGTIIYFLDCDLCELLDARVIRAILGLHLFGFNAWRNQSWQNARKVHR